MTPADHPEPPTAIVTRVRAICLALPGAVEHEAWTGTSWRVRGATFAHVVEIAHGWPPAYSTAFETGGPATVVTFQLDPEERPAIAAQGPPFFLPRWRPGIAGLVIDSVTDWSELEELITDSHRLLS